MDENKYHIEEFIIEKDKEFYLVNIGETYPSQANEGFMTKYTFAAYEKKELNIVDSLKNIQGKYSTIEFNSRSLPSIRTGTIWKNGKIISHPKDYAKQKEMTLKINSSENNISYIKDNPYSKFLNKFFFNDTLNTPCITLERISGNKKNTFIIPCYVIMNSFFFSSSKLTERILEGGMIHERVFHKDKSFIEIDPQTNNKHVFIWLTKYVNISDALTIAFLASSEYASKAVNEIYYSILKNKYNSLPSFPDCTFPFSSGDIKIVGKPIFINDNHYLWLVHDITSAKFDPGFNSFSYESDIDFRKIENPDYEKMKEVKSNQALKITIENPENTPIWRGPSNPQKTSLNISILSNTLINNVQNLGRIDKISQKTYSNKTPIHSDEYNSVTLGNLTSDEQLLSVKGEFCSSETIEDSTLSDYLESFCLCIDFMEEGVDKINPVQINNPKKCNIPYSYFNPSIFKTSEQKKWCFMKYWKGKWYNKRKFLLFEVVYSEYNFYFLEIDQRYPSETFSTFIIHNINPKNKVALTELELITNLCAQNGGRKKWWNHGSLVNYKICNLDHLQNVTPEDRASRYLKKLNMIINKL